MTLFAVPRAVRNIGTSTPFFQRQARQLPSNCRLIQFSTKTSMPLKFAEGQDEPKVQADLDALLANGWELDDAEAGIRKTYHLKTYTKVMDLHHMIGVGSKSKNHHSEMTTKAGSLSVHWTSHHPPGLSAKDTLMAKYCDDQAKIIGTVDKSDAQRCGPAPSSQI